METALIVTAVTLSLALVGFWIWMLVDCLVHEPVQDNQRLTWALVIALTKGVGAFIYYFVRRRPRLAPRVGAA